MDESTISYLQPYSIQTFHSSNHADAIYIQHMHSLKVDAHLATAQVAESDGAIEESPRIATIVW